MSRNRLGLSALVLALSVLSAYLCAAALVFAEQLSLTPSDLAYGQPISAAFTDPFVVMTAGTVASIVGLAIFPVALFCLWKRDLMRCGLFVVGLTLVFIIGATPLSPRVGS